MTRRTTIFRPRSPCPSGDFTLFSELPIEIRKIIWEQAIEPRLVEISCRESRKPRDGVKRRTFITKTMSPQPYRDHSPRTYFTANPLPHQYPTLLRINSESRATMLNIYRPCFAKEFGGRPIYIDLLRDTIYFANPIALLSFYGIEQPCQFSYSELINEVLAILPEERNDIEKSLKSIAISWGWGSTCIRAVLCRFQSLEGVIFQNEFTISDGQTYEELDLSHDVSKLKVALKKAAEDRGIASTDLKLPIIECVPIRKILKRFQVSENSASANTWFS
jgi:hypothetical protein